MGAAFSLAVPLLSAAVLFFLVLRLYPIWPARLRGCDAYNILLCAEYVQRARRLPPRIDGLFILEQAEQWYPPLFFVLCALVPQAWLRRRFWLFNQLVDLASALLLFAVVASVANAWVALAAVAIYAMVAGLVQEFSALTTRPLGLLVVNALVLSTYLASIDLRWFPLAVLAGVVLIYAHKLSAQQTWFTLPLLAVATGNWVWTAILPAMYLAAFIVWPRGFREVMRGHIAIVRFWHRNWPLLGAHAVKQSPVYGDGRTRTDFYAAWEKGALLKFAKETLHQNYFILAVAAYAVSAATLSPFELMLLAWIVSVYVTAAATHFWPLLRGIGLGRQYVKFALLPSLVLTAAGVYQSSSPLVLAATALAVLLTVRQYWLVARLFRAEKDVTGAPSAELDRLLARLAADPGARIMALPVQLCDLVAYATRRPVYWGTHAQVFDDTLEAFYPVLRRRIADYAADARLNVLLLDTRYAQPSDLGLPEPQVIERAGPYALVQLATAGTAVADQAIERTA